jgi:hypothetical protein
MVGTCSALVDMRNGSTYGVKLSLGCGETVESTGVVGGREWWGRVVVKWAEGGGSGRDWAEVGE